MRVLKTGWQFRIYELGGIYQDKQQSQMRYQQAIALWQELYYFTGLETYKGYIEHVKGL
ncbi:MAG: hypothetical protein KAH84_03500 [Thiomargarita sp.]|nr:hypothetical protein [Thiomargarita sp.]